jgi:RsiW-degrading membrane proteinase PrsW (M82 family)
MFSVLSELNWIAIAAGTVALAVLGFVWFAVLFPKVYAIALGKQDEPPKPLAPIFIAGPFVCGLVTTIASAILIRAFKIESVADGLIFGAIVGIGFLTPTTVNTGINPNIPRPLVYGLVSGSYFFLAGLIVSVILVALK